MIREVKNVSEEGVKGAEKATVSAKQNNMHEAREVLVGGRIRRMVCKCSPPYYLYPPCDHPRRWWQAPFPGENDSRSR